MASIRGNGPAVPLAAGINVHVYQTPCTHESRILKITKFLARHGHFERIVIAATWHEGLSEREQLDERREVVRVRARHCSTGHGALGKVTRALEWQARVAHLIWRIRPTCLNCHNVWLLPLCIVLKWLCRCRLIYDTHELETETSASHGVRRLVVKLIERMGIRAADAVVVVGETIGEWYRHAYSLPQVYVVRNLPPARESILPSSRLRTAVGLSEGEVLCLYQGVLGKGRGIPVLLKAFESLPSHIHLVFLGYGAFQEQIVQTAARHANVHFLPAVPPDELAAWTAGADLGVSLIEDISLSYRYCLPNKFFEYLQAGVPVLASSLPEMRALIDQHACGWHVAPDASEIASLLRGLHPSDLRRCRCHAVACSGQYTWEREERVLFDLYGRLALLRRSSHQGGGTSVTSAA
ncbi:MAG: glycosyltransferase family 4 protein [Pirellulaceae bacterium]